MSDKDVEDGINITHFKFEKIPIEITDHSVDLKTGDQVGDTIDKRLEHIESTNAGTIRVVSPPNQVIEVPEVIYSGWRGHLFPFGICYELRKLFRLAIPIAITSLCNYIIGPISVMFCGHLGSFELATVGLAISVFNVTGLAVAMGLLTACDTLFAQIYGSNELDKMGLNLQRSMLLMALCCLPCWSLHLVIEPVLLALKQNPLIAKDTAMYLSYMIPSLLFVSMGQIFTKYVQAQNHTLPPLIIGTCANILNALLHYVLLYHTTIGIRGSAIAQGCTYLFQTVAFCLYTKCHRMSVITWNNYSSKLWFDWGAWFKLAIPGLFMVTLEWTIFEIGSLVAGVLGPKELAAQTIIYNLESICYTLLPLGVGLAACIRVGHFLGAGSAIGPRSVSSVSFIAICILSLPLIVLFTALREYIPRIFTQDTEVIKMAAHILPILAFFQLFDGIVGVLSGIVRGAGLQYIGGFICFVSLYCIGAPMGICLIFVQHTGIEGLWWGLCTGVIISSGIYLITILRLNWPKQVERTLKRIQALSQKMPVQVPNYQSILDEGQAESMCKTTTPNKPCTINLEDPRHEGRLQVHINRILLIGAFVIIFVGCLACRCTLDWSDYFGVYCLYPNGTFVNFRNQTELEIFSAHENCTGVIP